MGKLLGARRSLSSKVNVLFDDFVDTFDKNGQKTTKLVVTMAKTYPQPKWQDPMLYIEVFVPQKPWAKELLNPIGKIARAKACTRTETK